MPPPFSVLALGATLPALGAEWEDLTGKKLEDFWTTKGPWTLDDDGVFHLPEQKEKTWTRYDHYLVLKDRKMKDFEIEFEVKTTQNSGLYFHIPDLANVPERKHVEVQIFENSAWPEGKPLGDHAAGGIIPGHPPTKDACKPGVTWNKYYIRCVDNQITVTINGDGREQGRPQQGAHRRAFEHRRLRLPGPWSPVLGAEHPPQEPGQVGSWSFTPGRNARQRSDGTPFI